MAIIICSFLLGVGYGPYEAHVFLNLALALVVLLLPPAPVSDLPL